LVALTSLVIFTTNLATTKNIGKKKKKKKQSADITRNLKLFTKAIFKVMILFFLNTCMRILYKPYKIGVYAIFSSGYFIYSLDWNITFRLS